MKREIKYYEKDGKQFAIIRFIGEKSGIVAESDTATFPPVYYYPHLQLYDRHLYINDYERMHPECPCMTCGNFLGGRCAMINHGICHTIDDWNRQMERRKNPRQLKLYI